MTAYECSISVQVDADSPEDAARLALADFHSFEVTWIVEVAPIADSGQVGESSYHDESDLLEDDDEPAFDGPSCERCGVQPAALCECDE